MLGALVAGAGVMFLVDLLPSPFIERYPVAQLPLLAVAGGAVLAFTLRQVDRPAARPVAAATGLVLLLANPFAATREAAGRPSFVESYR